MVEKDTRESPELATARCTFCHKNGHKEIVSRQKPKASDESNARASESGAQHDEVSFFHGRPAECNVITFSSKAKSIATLLPQPASGIRAISSSDKWIADTGASEHICRDKSKFKSMQTYTGVSRIHTISGSMEVTQVGTVELVVDGQDGTQVIVLENVLYQEDNKLHIYSLQRARRQNYYYGYDRAAEGKIRLLETLPSGTIRQVALMTEAHRRWTLDVKPKNPSPCVSLSILKQSNAPVESVISIGSAQASCYAGQLSPRASFKLMSHPRLVAVNNSYS